MALAFAWENGATLGGALGDEARRWEIVLRW